MGSSTPRRAAIYVRVSSDAQTTDCQYPEIERLLRARGYTLVSVYREQVSAAKKRAEKAATVVRPEPIARRRSRQKVQFARRPPRTA
jgi:predicted site-specific integrase-resolvase